MNEKTANFELLEPANPEALVPDPLLQPWMIAAAAVLLLAITAYWIFRKRKSAADDPLAARGAAYQDAAAAVEKINALHARKTPGPWSKERPSGEVEGFARGVAHRVQAQRHKRGAHKHASRHDGRPPRQPHHAVQRLQRTRRGFDANQRCRSRNGTRACRSRSRSMASCRAAWSPTPSACSRC